MAKGSLGMGFSLHFMAGNETSSQPYEMKANGFIS